ncbi:hypothetical protein CLPU_5c01550 [Gottschalkia purinilytica]|uniref:Uncharacterized protein n=1 Tax=Gottschalkia purinilytica TaxID=1503 RepID=A0A0L0WBH6_GOTPU|nr:hypothetical protein [Gottschalkia purinilytica]KNF08848.1 hypothetical protein CLPU_5c01550 [Gottschalkia purinilytica]
MKQLDILGLTLEEGIKEIKDLKNNECEISIRETFAYNKEQDIRLTEARILKVIQSDNVLNIIVSYF